MSAHTAPSARRSAFAGLPRIAVRTRTSENQMAMFSVISIGAIAFMMLLPSPRAAFGAVEAEAPAIQMVVTTEKAPRLVISTETDKACAGQAWASESLDCILAIAKDSGLKRSIRLADATIRH
ncbi:MAG: hypothetical protein M9939_19220 [Mesorhizobium sp.]|nr:hypothetical protein [Mesorhizobium sp.]MCO5163269.1 hypothetical protein [Mesorhizobium sp.]